jgi:hypothetical protein
LTLETLNRLTLNRLVEVVIYDFEFLQKLKSVIDTIRLGGQRRR